jgi:hypothetical protein
MLRMIAYGLAVTISLLCIAGFKKEDKSSSSDGLGKSQIPAELLVRSLYRSLTGSPELLSLQYSSQSVQPKLSFAPDADSSQPQAEGRLRKPALPSLSLHDHTLKGALSAAKQVIHTTASKNTPSGQPSPPRTNAAFKGAAVRDAVLQRLGAPAPAAGRPATAARKGARAAGARASALDEVEPDHDYAFYCACANPPPFYCACANPPSRPRSGASPRPCPQPLATRRGGGSGGRFWGAVLGAGPRRRRCRQ